MTDQNTSEGQPCLLASQARATDPLLLTLPILERMRQVEGWLDEEEADLLIAAAARALSEPGERPAVVEIGSYKGRSTVVLGSTIERVRPDARIYAIDPHQGQVGAEDTHLFDSTPTLVEFLRNIRSFGLTGFIEPILRYSYEVEWERPIRMLLIDGLHDYASVSRDFRHFETWVEPGGFVAFHDYATYYPGVVRFVDELLGAGTYHCMGCVQSLIVLRKSASVIVG